MHIPPPRPITLLTVDDHPLFQQGMASVIRSEPAFALVGQASNGMEAIAMHRRLRPDVTLMDLQMPGMDGVEAIEIICSEVRQARIIALTMLEGEMHALRAIRAGAAGYLLKSVVRKLLLETVRSIHAGGRCIPAQMAHLLVGHWARPTITRREIEVLRQVAWGSSNSCAATALGISEETVKTHMRSILMKLEARDRTHAVMIAMQRGFLEVSPFF